MGGMTIGLMGSAEQVSITNVAFPDANTIQVMVMNAGGTDAVINSAFINGAGVANFQAVTVLKSSSTVISFVNPSNATFTLNSGTSYTVKLITAKGTSVVSPATTYST
jgi:hypothetical protein